MFTFTLFLLKLRNLDELWTFLQMFSFTEIEFFIN